MDNNIPESVKEERKKKNQVEYDPSERLLIKLGKQREKERNNNAVSNKAIDVDRITQSLSRVLSIF